jgi:pimeloyl-ACP methyl ester carboxylesterase
MKNKINSSLFPHLNPFCFLVGVLLILLTLLLSGCSKGNDEIQITPLIPEEQSFEYGVAENIEEVECQFANGDDDGPEVNAQCGFLTVPEDRNEPDGKKIRLPYTILKARETDGQADPIVVLFNSPMPVMGFGYQLRYFFGEFLANRDIILLEQRGVGESEPSLDCPDVDRLYDQNQEDNPDSETITQEIVDGIQACYQKHLNDGIKLEAYSTAESAADLEDLRQALGIQEWNLFGFGNGATLTLELMQRFPGSVRSAILESPILTSSVASDEALAAYAQASLDAFFKSCEADSQCAKAFPNLASVFYQQVDRLNASPVTLQVTDLNDGRRYDQEVDGNYLLEFVLGAVGNAFEGILPELPRAIYNLQFDKTDYLSKLLGNQYGFGDDDRISSGMQLNIYCGTDPEKASKSAKTTTAIQPQVWETISQELRMIQRLCEAWPVVLDDKARDSYQSSVPALVLVGEFASDTPPEIARQIAGFLPHSTLVEFPGGGVFPTASQTWSDCSRSLQKQLLDNPGLELDTSCAEEEKNLLWITIP